MCQHCDSYLVLECAVTTELAQHSQMSHQPPCESQRILTVCGEANELLCCWLP